MFFCVQRISPKINTTLCCKKITGYQAWQNLRGAKDADWTIEKNLTWRTLLCNRPGQHYKYSRQAGTPRQNHYAGDFNYRIPTHGAL
jgi:hypothetical protein